MHIIYLDVKYFSVVFLSLYYEKLAVKPRLQRWDISSQRNEVLLVGHNL